MDGKNTLLQEHPPFDEVFPLVKLVLEDKKVDNEEAIRLKEFFASHLE